MITLIAALDRNRIIGADGHLPWQLPSDLAHFKKTTEGKIVIMGRRTHQSIGKALPNRLNVVLSRAKGNTIHTDDQGVVWCPSIQALSDCCAIDEDWMVIGGAQIYQQMLPYAHAMILTRVEAEVVGDCRFPTWDPTAWQTVASEHHAQDARNDYAFVIEHLKRVDAPKALSVGNGS